MNGFPYGEIGPLPDDFAPPECWPEFGAVAVPVSICAREEVGTEPKGVRWSLWPFTFEEYVSDHEPDLTASSKGPLARTRVIHWKRVHGAEIPEGWRHASRPWRIDGYKELGPGDLTENWGTDAKRHLKAWREQHARAYTIEPVSWDEYRAAYLKSGVAQRMRTDLIDILERKRALPECIPHLELWGVRDGAGEVVAGTGILYSPTFGASVREAPFVSPAAARTGAATALMAHWMERSRQKGMRYAVSTHFWQQGEPRRWQGFSQFKSRFGFSFVAYPPLLWRFRGGKFF